MQRVLRHLRGNVIAYLALFVALGGTSYAAIRLPAGSVGTRALQNHSVTPIKFDRGSIAGYVRDWATISPDGKLMASRPQAHLLYWDDGPGAQYPSGLVVWKDSIPASCFRVATSTSARLSSGATYASATAPASPKSGATLVQLSTSQTGVSVAVICPQP